MGITKTVIGAKVFYVDNDAKALFTKGEMVTAMNRYKKELAKKLIKGE